MGNIWPKEGVLRLDEAMSELSTPQEETTLSSARHMTASDMENETGFALRLKRIGSTLMS
jgi:hypothetical protein